MELARRVKLKVYYYGGESAVNNDEGFGQQITWDIPLLKGYDFEFLKNTSNSGGFNTKFFDAINLSVVKIIKNSNEEVVVVNGWAYFTDWLILCSAKVFRKKVWMRAEMPWNQELLKPNTFKKRLKYFFFKNILFKYLVDKFLYIGTQNKIYFEMHGVHESRLIYTPYAVDNNKFQNLTVNRYEERVKWGIDVDGVVIVMSGKLIEKKRPMDLLKAFHELNITNAFLFFMGDGPLKEEIKAYVDNFNLSNVIISGFINQSQIGLIYSMADIFVMCSGVGETWGLAANEAMNCRLPLIISGDCGCAFDLVDLDKNGYVYGCGNINDLRMYLLVLINDRSRMRDMGEFSKLKVNSFSFDLSVSNICDNIMKSELLNSE
jgi:glycosyltransferase involved in cell wall biosynthesis